MSNSILWDHDVSSFRYRDEEHSSDTDDSDEEHSSDTDDSDGEDSSDADANDGEHSSDTEPNAKRGLLEAEHDVLAREDTMKMVCSFLGKGHLFFAGTQKLWRALYAKVDRMHRTSVGTALASEATTRYSFDAGFMDVHRFHKDVCQWKLIYEDEKCRYSSSKCCIHRPDRLLEQCVSAGCRHELSAEECTWLATAFGSAAGLRATIAALQWWGYPCKFPRGFLLGISDTAVERGSVLILKALHRLKFLQEEEKYQDSGYRGRPEPLFNKALWLHNHEAMLWLHYNGFREFSWQCADLCEYLAQITTEEMDWLRTEQHHSLSVTEDSPALSAAAIGDLEQLRFALKGVLRWVSLDHVMHYARGRDVMEWLHSTHNVALRQTGLEHAVAQGDMDTFEWCRQNGAEELTDLVKLADIAIKYGQLQMLHHLHAISTRARTPTELKRLLFRAGSEGLLEVCMWLRDVLKAPFPQSLFSGDPDIDPSHFHKEDIKPWLKLNILRWAIENGAEWHDETSERPKPVAKRCCILGQHDFDDYDTTTDERVPQLADCETFHWAHEHGCPCDCEEREKRAAAAQAAAHEESMRRKSQRDIQRRGKPPTSSW